MPDQHPPTTRAPRRTRHDWVPRGHALSWGMLAITTAAILTTSIDGGLLAAVLPLVQADFGLTAQQLGLVNSAFFAGTLVGAVVFGVVADRLGTGHRRSWTWFVAMGIGVLGGVLTFGFASSLAAFLVLRAVMGVSRGGSETTNVALVGEWWPREHRGFAVGVHHTGFPIGQFLTGVVVAAVLAFATWREVFLLVPLLGVPVMLAQVLVGTRRNQHRVEAWTDERGLTRPVPAETARRAPASLLAPVRAALAVPNVRWTILLVFLVEWVETGASTFLATDLVHVGLEPGRAAIVAGATGLTGWIGQVVWGTLSDSTGRKRSLRWLVVGWAASMAGLVLLSGETSGWLLLLFWGLFRNAPFPVAYALLMDSVPEAAGTAMGLVVGVAVGLSGVLVGPVAGSVIDGWGYHAHYLVLAAVALLALYPVHRLRETAVLARSARA